MPAPLILTAYDDGLEAVMGQPLGHFFRFLPVLEGADPHPVPFTAFGGKIFSRYLGLIPFPG